MLSRGAASEQAVPAHRHHLRWWLLALVVLVAAGIVGWAALAAVSAERHLQRVRADVQSLRANPHIDRASLQARLTSDAAEAKAAVDQLSQAGPWAVARIPVLGRSWVAEKAVADTAAALLTGMRDTLAQATDLGSPGDIHVAQWRRVAADLQTTGARVHTALVELDHASTSFVPPMVAHGVTAARQTLDGSDTLLTHAGTAVGALADIMGGDRPRTILVALQNNAELRATGGLISSFALVRADGGRLTLGKFRDVAAVAKQANDATAVPAPAQYVAHYGAFRANTTLWKNVNMSPDVPTSAQVLANVAKASTGTRPDVVLLLDVPALARIAAAHGPVRMPDGTTVTGADLTSALLVDSYRTETESARRVALEAVASEAMKSIVHQKVSWPLVSAMVWAGRGRHLALWSADPGEENALRAAGLAGSVDPRGADIVLVTAHNLGDAAQGVGNKLDYYVDRRVDVTATVGPRAADVTQTVTLTNTAPRGLPAYVEGVSQPGTVRELVSVAAAADATYASLTVNGVEAPAYQWQETGSDRFTVSVTLAPGQHATIVLRYRTAVSDGTYHVRLFPQPLAHDAQRTLTVCPARGGRIDRPGALAVHGRCVGETGPWSTVEDRVVGVGPAS